MKPKGLTDRQARSLVYAIESCIETASYGGRRIVEFKPIDGTTKISITPIGRGIVAVQFCLGSPTDEGTLASCFCRYRHHFKIGPRGAISNFVNKSHRGERALFYSSSR